MELAVKDDKAPSSLTPTILDYYCHMGVAGFGFAIAACLVPVGC